MLRPASSCHPLVLSEHHSDIVVDVVNVADAVVAVVSCKLLVAVALM